MGQERARNCLQDKKCSLMVKWPPSSISLKS